MFYEDVIAEREGGQPMNNNISAGNSSDNTSNTRVHYLDYEAPTNVEWLWSITVAIFVLFGMIGAFVSGKWADYFGRQVHVCDSISLFNIIYVCSEVDLRLSRWMYKFTYQSGPFGYCNARKLCCESFQTCCFVLWTCKFVSRKWTAIHYGYFTTTKPTPSSCTFFSSWINKMSSQRKNCNCLELNTFLFSALQEERHDSDYLHHVSGSPVWGNSQGHRILRGSHCPPCPGGASLWYVSSISKNNFNRIGTWW